MNSDPFRISDSDYREITTPPTLARPEVLDDDMRTIIQGLGVLQSGPVTMQQFIGDTTPDTFSATDFKVRAEYIDGKLQTCRPEDVDHLKALSDAYRSVGFERYGQGFTNL